MHHEEVIIISGCASGIGRYLAENLYKEGHCLALTAKIASFQPKLADLLLKKLTEKGSKRQAELKEK